MGNYKRLTNLFLIICAIVVTLIFVETLCAIFRPVSYVSTDIFGRKIRNRPAVKVVLFNGTGPSYYDSKPYDSGTTSLLRSYKYSWYINKFSLRHNELSARKELFRILVLGDSQTFGYVPPDKTWPAQLEHYLNSNNNRVEVEVLNAGVPGYGTHEAMWKGIRIIKDIQPDMVLIAFFGANNLVPCEGNDLYQNYVRFNQASITDKDQKQQRKTTLFERIQKLFADHSHLYGLLSAARKQLSGVPSYLEQVRQYRNSPDSEILKKTWNKTTALLQTIRNTAIENNAASMVVYLPDMASLLDDDRSVEPVLKKSGLPVISTFDVLYKTMKNNPWNLRTQLDEHYNEHAFKVIAEEVGSHLIQ